MGELAGVDCQLWADNSDDWTDTWVAILSSISKQGNMMKSGGLAKGCLDELRKLRDGLKEKRHMAEMHQLVQEHGPADTPTQAAGNPSQDGENQQDPDKTEPDVVTLQHFLEQAPKFNPTLPNVSACPGLTQLNGCVSLFWRCGLSGLAGTRVNP